MPFANSLLGNFDRWKERLQRRLSGTGDRLLLRHHNIYILPTAFGVMWLPVIAITYVLGIQTQSNGPVLLALLLLALLLFSPFLTYRNIVDLELRCLEPVPGFADQSILVPIIICSADSRQAIKLRWLNRGQPLSSQQIEQFPAGSKQLVLPWQPPGRGQYLPGRLLIHTTSPLGLFCCFSYWQPPVHLFVAPACLPGPVQELQQPMGTHYGLAEAVAEGSDEFQDLTPLRPEAGLQRVSWKTVARGQGWYSKRFTCEKPVATWLSPVSGLPLERALEHVCERLCQGLAKGEQLGLLLPGGCEIHPGEGELHRRECLRALAAVSAQLRQL